MGGSWSATSLTTSSAFPSAGSARQRRRGLTPGPKAGGPDLSHALGGDGEEVHCDLAGRREREVRQVLDECLLLGPLPMMRNLLDVVPSLVLPKFVVISRNSIT
jgi:hypothetical protein